MNETNPMTTPNKTFTAEQVAVEAIRLFPDYIAYGIHQQVECLRIARVVLRESHSLRAEVERLRQQLELISEQLCAVKVEGDITHDMVYAFVEGEIEKQYDLRINAEKVNDTTISRLREALQNLMNGIDCGHITSDHDETFANAIKQSREALTCGYDQAVKGEKQ